MKNPIIRTIYLYLFALIGLGMLVIGASMIINLGLKAWIFTKADQQETYIERPMPISVNREFEAVEKLEVCSDKCELTENQKEAIGSWLEDYEEQQNQNKDRDPDFYISRNRQRDASTALSLILIGLPLWLFHWFIIKRDLRRKED
jgi:hypothetical protein